MTKASGLQAIIQGGMGVGVSNWVLANAVSSEGQLVAMLMSADGSAHYGLDALLTVWIPAGQASDQMFGGLYGRVFEAYPDGAAFKARVEGSWRMISEESGVIDAQVLEESPKGARVVGRINGKFRVQRSGGGAGAESADSLSSATVGVLGSGRAGGEALVQCAPDKLSQQIIVGSRSGQFDLAASGHAAAGQAGRNPFRYHDRGRSFAAHLL